MYCLKFNFGSFGTYKKFWVREFGEILQGPSDIAKQRYFFWPKLYGRPVQVPMRPTQGHMGTCLGPSNTFSFPKIVFGLSIVVHVS